MPPNLVDELTKLRTALNGPSADIPRIIGTISEIEPEDYHQKSIGSFFYTAWKQIAAAHTEGRPSPIDTSVLKAATQAAGATSNASHHLRTALDYLLLWTEVCQYLHRHQLGPLCYTEILAEATHLSSLEHLLRAHRSDLSTEYGFFMLQGLLRGLSDREAAAESFHQAVSDNTTFASSQLLDSFLGTYLSDSEVAAKASQIAAQRTELRSSFEILEGQLPTQEGGTVLLFSCDPAFFSIFFPYWVSAAVYLRDQGIHLHFVLVGSRSDAETSLKHGLNLVTAVARLRGFPPDVLSECLSFSRVAIPNDVGELRTLYACARFLVARELVSATPARLLIVDIDIEINSDPRLELQEIAANVAPTQMPVVVQRGLHTLIPSYRLPAYRGVLLPGPELVSDVLTDLEDYIYAALPLTPSWLLDQNALDYAAVRMAARRGSTSLVEINRYLSPFQQRPIAQTYKAHARSC